MVYILPPDSLVAQAVKSLPAMQETRVRSLGLEDSPGEGIGNPLQYSCLESPMDGGAQQAIVHWVTKSQTRLKQLSGLAHLGDKDLLRTQLIDIAQKTSIWIYPFLRLLFLLFLSPI